MYDIKEDKVNVILTSAQKLFAKKGLSNTTIEDIAKKAGIGTGSIYYYFNSKEEIFMAVIKKEGNALQNTIIKAINDKITPQEKVKTFFITRMNELKKLVNYYCVIHNEYKQYYATVEKVREAFDTFEITLLTNILQEGVNKGEFHINDVTLAAETLLAAIKGLELKWTRELSWSQIKIHINDLITILFTGIELRV